MKQLLYCLITAQSLILLSIVVFLSLYLRSDLLSREPETVSFIERVRLADRYYCACLFFAIMVAIIVIDYMLLKRLKLFYPNFYKKEKGKVLIES